MGRYTNTYDNLDFTEFSVEHLTKSLIKQILFLTLTTAFLHQAVISLHHYYGSEPFWEEIPFYLKGLKGLAFFVLLNHLLLWIETRKRNNIIGRILVDVCFVFFYVLLEILNDFLYSNSIEFDFVSYFLGLCVISLFFECLLAITLLVLNYFKWIIRRILNF